MKKIFAYLTLGFTTLTTYAATPLWMRDIQISPDGTEIVFCYKGDIYKVSAKGGTATQLTTQESYESSPVWSPDGKQIAFASDRQGNFDVFVMPSDGGAAQRLTTNSAGEIPSAFTPDGKYILFSAAIQDPAGSALFPSPAMTELYKVPATGGRTEQVLGTPAEALCFDKTGDMFFYQDQKGFEDQWRKHHTSSITRDIWMYDCRTEKHTNLTRHAGEDRNPVLSPDGQTLYFLSERNGGSFNVYSLQPAHPEAVKAVSSFKTHPVRFLSISGNGTLCYGYDGEIYTQQDGAAPQKVQIEIIRDDRPDTARLTFTNGATSATVSPDGKQVAFIARGEVFVTSADYATTKQITHTPAGESGLSFAPDNRTLAYASERNGNWQLYLAKIVRKEDPNFPNATIVEEEALLPSATVERAFPQFSPDGKELAFIEDRTRLMVVNLDTKKVRQITDGSTWYSTDGGFDYAWSPDGKWFTLEFIGNRHDPYSDIGLVSAQGNSPIINLTNSGYMSGSPRFALDGNAILFKTERYGMRAHASWGSQDDAMLVFLNQDAYDKYCLNKEDYELRKELEAEQKKAQSKDTAKGKHFPGHGDTEVDSHKALPVLNFDRARLDSIELFPFKEAVKAGLGGMMVGHLEVPELGKNPASISSHIIYNLLCRELGFQGLVFTDALEMKGISQNENICAQALIAGNDLLLAPRNLKRELDGVLNAVKSGKLSEELITEKCRKVLTYKYVLGLKNKPHIQLSGLEKRLNRPETKELILRLQKAATF